MLHDGQVGKDATAINSADFMINFIEKYLNLDDSDDQDVLTFLREQQSLLSTLTPETDRRNRPRVDLDGEIVLQVNGLRVQRRLLNLSQGGRKNHWRQSGSGGQAPAGGPAP